MPDRIESLHRAFVDAGSDIILTNTFGANRRRLMLHKLEGRTHELNRLAAKIARKVADSARRPVVVAGSVGPTGDLLAPLGPLSEDEAVEIFIEQIEGLREGGADVAWIETMSAPEEMRAAALAAAKCGMPYTVTASFDTAGRTMMGVAPAAFSDFVQAFDPAPVAYGANCGVGASDLLAAILGMAPGATLIAKANAGVPQWHGAEIHYSGTPELMERLRRPRRGLRRAHHWRLLRQQPGPCRGDAARPRRPQSRRASGRGGDRRGARSPRRAARGGERRQPAAPAGTDVNSKAKQRAQSGYTEPVESDPEDAPSQVRAPRSAHGARRSADFRRRRRERGRAARPLPGPGGGGKTNRSVAHPAEGADRGRRSEDRRQRRARSFDAARRGRAHRLRGAAGGGIAPHRRGHPACRGLRGRASDRDRQAGRARRPSGAGPCGGHAGQRADPPLRSEPVGNRRGQAARNRAPAGQGHVGASGRRQDGRRASGPGGPLRRPWPHRLLEARISGARLGRLRSERGQGRRRRSAAIRAIGKKWRS